MKQIKFITIFIGLLILPFTTFAQNVSDHLILQNIGNFSNDGKNNCREGSGIVGPVGHFDVDHHVTTCVTHYHHLQQKMNVEVKVEQHAGGDSDRWLLHEIEDSYRDEMGLLTDGAIMRRIPRNGDYKRFLWLGLGSGHFRWLSNNIVVNIEYVDLQQTKPEPIEIVNAYLTKFPSTITVIDAEFQSKAYNEKWLKDEMERRMWLCDKWFVQIQIGKNNKSKILREIVNSLIIYLDYRERYYRKNLILKIKTSDDKVLLSKYLLSEDAIAIRTKHEEYKTWWNDNRDKSLNL